MWGRGERQRLLWRPKKSEGTVRSANRERERERELRQWKRVADTLTEAGLGCLEGRGRRGRYTESECC